MPSAGALVALVVLVTAGAALADEPAFKPARLVSRFEPQKPAAGGARSAPPERPTVQPAEQEEVYPTLDAWSDYFTPIRPEAGKKQKATIYITNSGDQCGDKGESNYKLPELAPLQTKAIKASWKVSETPGEAAVLVFIDSACTAFNSSAYFGQRFFYTMVVEAGTKYAYLEVATTFRSLADEDGGFTPTHPVPNGMYTANIPIVNLGTAPSEEGVKMGVYANYWQIPDNVSTDCTYPGEYSADIPKLAPGKTKVVAVEGIKAPKTNDGEAGIDVFLDVTCKLSPTPVGMWVKTTPKQPKINGTMTVKVKITNVGDAEGPVGRVVVFTTPLDYLDGLNYAIEYRCNPALPEWVPGSTYSFNTTDIVIKAGKSKTVKITDVPVPDTAGWWGLMVVPDADCVNAAQKDMWGAPLPLNVFEAVAP
ncbi:hypothetical protein Rsub_09617 [Raphidocelis subcapitata]|uniref:CARDB domain-containing protein n=1 Tax=Raphidocelis subcapitata TaxID=307507 RepID=A0A2V0PA78_9CHLO|nr:hypothetical protein Rsub_09617 [Raphidocelis subcapitata]|eukprot:GBF96761.1 hypothetical protein Rsub_09617 [Raphidocelis subcapitata]